MNKQAIIHSLADNHNSFMNYINELTADEYSYSFQQKWTAAQQLEHIVLCVKPLVQVFSLDKSIIEQNFGRTDRQNRTYEILLKNYLEKLNEDGKAPTRFVAEAISQNDKQVLIETLTKSINDLCLKIQKFNDEELDSLLIPHPLLENLTLREMLYNAIYHVTHHQKLTELGLKHK